MKHNLVNFYKHVLEMVENPRGVDSQERSMARNMALKNKANLEQRFSKGKYADDPEIKELLGKKEEKKEVKGEKPKKAKEE